VRLVQGLYECVVGQEHAQLVLFAPEVTKHPLGDASHLARAEGDRGPSFSTDEHWHGS
jgi:hypothetical protein